MLLFFLVTDKQNKQNKDYGNKGSQGLLLNISFHMKIRSFTTVCNLTVSQDLKPKQSQWITTKYIQTKKHNVNFKGTHVTGPKVRERNARD